MSDHAVDYVCIQCQGHGIVYAGDYGTMLADPCPHCGGSGYEPQGRGGDGDR